MKKVLISLLFVVVLVFVTPTPTLAQTDTGPVPGSFWYGITTTFENVNLFFTFNAEKKAEKALNYAERHLTQAKTAVENENTDATEIALTDYEEKLKLATKSSKKIEDGERAEKLLTTIADNTARHQETLSEVLEKVPEEAREAIIKAIEVSKHGQEEATQKIAELKGEVERLKKEVAELKQNNNDEQTAEIKKLKKEVEELKKKPATAPPVVTPVLTTPTQKTQKKQLEIKSETRINKQHETESQAIEEKIRQADIEIAELERQKTKAEAETQKQADAEAQRQEELQKQAELEQRLTEEYEAQTKAQEEQEQQKREAQTIQKIKSDINYFSNLISSVNQDIEQLANAYHAGLDREQISYLNQTDSYTSIYKPSLTKRHREILNEASKGIWTDCTWLRDLWDYQDGDYQQYSTALNNAERTLKSNIDFIASSYMPDFNFYLNQINRDKSIHIPTKTVLNQYLNKLNSLFISDIETSKNEIRNLISELRSLESKINDAKSYNFSYTTSSSILSGINPLIQEEKAWFTKASCKNLDIN